MFDLVPWKPLPLPLSDHLQVSGWVSVRRRVLLQSPSYGLTQLTFQRKELSFHPCVCQTRPQPIPPRVCWEVGKRSMSRQRSLHCAQCAPLCHTTIQKGCLRVCCRWMAQKKRNPLRPTQVFSKEGKWLLEPLQSIAAWRTWEHVTCVLPG